VFVHAILDGRDTPPKSSERYLRSLLEHLAGKPKARLATVIGRYFTMDRDRRWERVQRGYDLMTLGIGTETKDVLETLRRFYAQDVTDEFVEPISVLTPEGAHLGRVEDGDVILFSNFRADRMRQIVTAFKDEAFDGFVRAVRPNVRIATVNRYHEDFDLPVLFPPEELRNNLGEVLARAGLRQLRIAETEKYAHVTFFFNGGRETVFPDEDRILVPSPRDVKTYDEKPEMSAREVTDKLVSAIGTKQYGFILVNFANPDMVGHTGLVDAAVKAVKVVDECVGRLWKAAQAAGMAMIVTADHGNCEMMTDPVTGQPHTAHTLNPVPFILADPDLRGAKLRGKGVLADVAPTALQVMGLPQPTEMKGLGLLVR
jgi:2,3-bisphosphoglycerate-independent phosphoglycerate mutase